MLEPLKINQMARALASYSGARLGLVARNVAQADTPGYKAVDLPSFADAYQQEQPSGMRATRPGHLTARSRMMEPVQQPSEGEMSPDGNTVSLAHELVKSVDIRQQHEMALTVYRNTSDIVRASLGRR